MNRRGHLSHKIPNVKLRPVPAPSAGPSRRTSARGSTSGARARHSSPPNAYEEEFLQRAWEDAGVSASGSRSASSGEKPWKSIVVTFTGVEDKPRLGALVRELGGSVESALTMSVTHVVASGYGSAKYLYAIEHQLPVLSPSWIIDAHSRWISGDEIDVEAGVESHRLEPFLGLKIAISGIDKLDWRKQLIRHITSHGGIYSKDLDRTCTHLISAHPTSDPKSKQSDKVKWALKELGERDASRRRGKRFDSEDLKIIFEEWIWDCIAYRGRWTEDAYDARKPRRSGKIPAEDVVNNTFVLPSLNNMEACDPSAQAQGGDQEEHEPVAVRKRKREGIDSLVGEILLTTATGKPDRGVETPVGDGDDGPLNTDSNTGVGNQDNPDLDTTFDFDFLSTSASALKSVELPRRPGPFERKVSVLHTSRSTSFAQPVAGPSRLDPSAPSGALGPPATTTTSFPASTASRPSTRAPPLPIFEGKRFSHAIPEGFQGLENALRVHGGVVVEEKDRLEGRTQVDFVIVRLTSRTHPPVPENEPRPIVVTECWVEGCCFEQRLLSPDNNLVFRPLDITTPIPDAETMLVHISGFPTETSVYLRRLVKTIGATYSEKLNRRTTHLVCAAPSGQKYDKALEWGVQVVRDSWLWTMGKSGRIEPIDQHGHDHPAEDRERLENAVAVNMSIDNSVGEHMVVIESLSAPQFSAVSSRNLKLAPTHVDAASVLASVSSPGANPLSPPKVTTERLLNRARPTASAPPDHESANRATDAVDRRDALKAAATVPGPSDATFGVGPGDGEGRDEMTAVLRRLAERDDTPGHRSKVLRRVRPASRVKLGAPSFPSSPIAPSPPSTRVMAMAAAADVPASVEDESMRVTYADPVSEKERRRLLDAVMRSGSPTKRSRV